MLSFTRYRVLAGLLTAALPALAFQCGCDDCAAPCQPERLGRLALHPASAAWLPAADSVRFMNSNGFRTTLRRVTPLTPDSLAQPALLGNPYTLDLLQFTGLPGCTPYFQTERRRLRYESRNLPLTLEYGLVRDLSGTYPSRQLVAGQQLLPAVADTLPDAVLVSFNDQLSSSLPVVRRPYRQDFQGLRYLDSVRVAGRTFFGVYRRLAPASPGSTAVRLAALYFQPGQGVVGFTYTNNEQWARY